MAVAKACGKSMIAIRRNTARALRRASELGPNASAKAMLAAALLLQGKKSEALEAVEQEPDDCWRLEIAAVVYWELDRKPESDAALSRLQTQCPQNVSYNIAEAHAFRGEVDAACAWLQRAYREQDTGMMMIRVDPLLRNLHRDPRYLALVAKMKLDGEPPAALR